MAGNIPNKVIKPLAITCVVLFVLDFLIDRHPHVPGEGFPAFYAICGFLAFTLIVLGAKQLRRLIKQPEDWYAPHAVDAEVYPESGLEKLEVTEANKASSIGGRTP